jgi:hypothetical protein
MSQRAIVDVRELPRPRILRKWRAQFSGYFWLSCPVCEQMFAGFECGKVDVPDPDQPDGALKIACLRHEYAA